MSMVSYTPPASVAPYLVDDSFIALLKGPLGSGKTTGSIMKIAYHAARMAACRDGVRRSRCVVVRNTAQMLSDSTIPDFLKWFPDGVAGSFAKTDKRFILRFGDVECEVLFRGLDDANDVRRLLSMQASFGFMDECREISKDIFEALQGRLGRYPDGLMVPHRHNWGLDEKGNPIQGCVTDAGLPNKHLFGSTNPPDRDTWLEEFMGAPPATAHVYHQPSGLSAEADWIKHLPSNYYEDLMAGKSDAWINVYIHGQFGESLAGKPVFSTFRSDKYVAGEQIRHIRDPSYPLIIGLDFGLTPAAVVGQIDPWGRLLILAELTSTDMGALRFAQERLKPLLATRFPGVASLIVGDPAGAQRAQTDERTVYEILRALRFSVTPARTNNVTSRLAAVEAYLGRFVDGKPALLIDPGCIQLIRALRGGYRYKLKKSGEAEDQPEKNSYSHVADALQYLCLHADGGRTFGSSGLDVQRREVKHASVLGWT
jgi:hypothetical protein